MVRYERSSLSGKDELGVDEDGKPNDKSMEMETENSNHVKFQTPSRNTQIAWHSRGTTEKILLVIILILLLAVFIFAILFFRAASKDADLCLSDVCVVVASGVIAAMDKTANPCQDFYEYACGNWVQNHHGPDGFTRWNVFQMIYNENQEVLRNVLVGDLNTTSSAELKAQAFYKSCIDEDDRIEEKGAEPLLKAVEKVGGWNITGNYNSEETDFNSMIQKLYFHYGEIVFFSFFVYVDDKSSDVNRIQIGLPSLLLPDAWYMLNESDADVLDAYKEYMQNVVTLLDVEITDDIQRQLDGIIEFGTQIANLTQKDDSHYNDPDSLYNKMTVSELQEIAPAINWLEYFRFAYQNLPDIQITENEPVIVMEPDLLSDVSKLILSTDVETLNNYMIWELVSENVGLLGESFRKAKSKYQAMLGLKPADSKWRDCIKATDEGIGNALGALFVRTAFEGKSKEVASEMVEEVRSAFKRNLPKLEWMDDDTRVKAKAKANAILDLIGFPDYLLKPDELDASYDMLQINETEYFDNSISVFRFRMVKNLESLRQSTDRNQWDMTPPTVNAYYSTNKNEMVFPAGILQSPFYDKNYPKALNFGGMGVVMGHELTHAFDDKGREYDKDGNMKIWWNNATINRFKDQTKCLVDQYNLYQVHGRSVNGKSTLGENIADNGGLKSAYYAYLDWVHDHGDEDRLPGIDVTNEQLFFLGFAQVWCSYSTPENDLAQLRTDEHSPPRYRVIGSLSNSVEFSNAYNCPHDAPMNPPDKCEVW